MSARVQRLRAQIGADRQAISRRISELVAIDPADLPHSAGARAITAVALHSLYGAVESVFERVACTLEGAPPSGSRWHHALLEEMALDLDEVRPAVISPESLALLRELLGFRHFFRHAYAVDLRAEKLAPLREAAVELGPILMMDLRRWDDFLRALAVAGV